MILHTLYIKVSVYMMLIKFMYKVYKYAYISLMICQILSTDYNDVDVSPDIQ